ncbi:hypothetical protein HPB49_022198 [Dermacentor silvarum]|uniref:Uncharacterized protein n=1 Tax=Dermacentor silvarum TaxID=543639 RepID=A0ACB8CBK6_DERSI|nr:hypothetical protein HPB49_022198 [Dermacentor silvarum]
MKSSCPFPPKDDNMEPDPSASFRCGLCRTNDHDITSPTCPTKLKATKKARQRRSRQQPSTSQGPPMKQVPVYNRYADLASLEEDASQVTTESTATSDAAKPTYSIAVRASISRPQWQRASQSMEDTPPPLANEEFQIDARLATLEKEIQRLKERRTLLQRRHDGARASQSTSTSIPAHVVTSIYVTVFFTSRTLALRCATAPASHLGSSGQPQPVMAATSSTRVLNRFVRHYEPLSYEPVGVRGLGRWKRSAAAHRHDSSRPRTVQVAFKAHGREFRLQLTQDRSVFSEDFSLVTSRGRVQPKLDHIYSGHVAGAPGSRVVGSLVDGVFSGRISLAPGDDDGDFYVERASPYLSSTSSSLFHSLIYAAKDVSFDGAGCGVHRHARDIAVGARRRHGRGPATPTNQRRARRSVKAAEMAPQVSQAPDANASGNAPADSGAPQRLSRRRTADEHPQGDAGRRQGKSVQRVCNIELSVDHTFYEVGQRKHSMTSAFCSVTNT